MHIAIDILAGLVLIFFAIAGWRKRFLLSVLGVVRVVLSSGAAYLSGRYLGFWLAELTHRPRLVTIPICAITAFALVAFGFHVIMYEIRARHEETKEETDAPRPILSGLSGGIINLSAGTLTLTLLFWLADLSMVGLTGAPIPGAADAQFARLTRTAVHQAVYFFTANGNNTQQAAALARMASNPAEGVTHLKALLSADTVQQLLTDPQFGEDLLSGDPDRIRQNAAIQRLFNDRTTLDELKELGLLSGYETKTGLSEKLAAFGQNPRIQDSLQSLQAKGLLSTDKMAILIRDPDFDIILSELIK